MATKSVTKRVPVKATPAKSALSKTMEANAAAVNKRQAEAGYVLGLVKALTDDSQRRGQLEAGRQTRATQAQLATTIGNIDRTHQLLLRWVRDYVEGK